MRAYIRAFRIAAEKAAVFLGIFNDLPPFVIWLTIQVQPLIGLFLGDPMSFVALVLSLLALLIAVYAATRGYRS